MSIKTFTKSAVAILFLISLSALAQSAVGQNEDFYVRHYSDENGLPQNSIKSIVADKYGFIWLATENGLVRFDGVNFYPFDKTNTAISNNSVFEIQPDLNGNRDRFYAASEADIIRIENGLARADSVYFNDRYQRIPHMKEGYLSVFLASGYPGGPVESINYALPYFIVLNAFAKGSFFLFEKAKTSFFSNWKKQWQLNIARQELKGYFALNGIAYHLSADGIIRFAENGISEVKITGEILSDPDFNPKNPNLRFFWNNAADQAFLLLNGRFYILKPSSGNSLKTELILNGFDFENNNISKVYYDGVNDRLFLGSLTRGLFVLSKKAFKTLTVSGKDVDNVMYAQAIFNKNQILIPRGNVLEFTGNSHVDKGLASALAETDDIGDRRGILVDRSGNIWRKVFTSIHKIASHGEKILKTWRFDDEVKTIYEGMDGRIWLGMKETGLQYLDPSDPIAKPKTLKVLPSISFLLQENAQKMWVATEKGLFMTHIGTGQTTIISGTEKLNIRSLFRSPSVPDGLFFTSYEDGFFLFEQGKLTHFPVDEQKNLAAAHCIVQYNKGFLWIPTNKGLFRFSVSELLNYARLPTQVKTKGNNPFYLYYTKVDGFNTNEFNGGCQPCGLHFPDGLVSLPSLNGLVIFRPDSVKPEIPDKPFIIDRFGVNGVSSLVTGDTITIGKQKNQIFFHVAMSYFGHESGRQFAFALIPANASPGPADWNDMDPNDPLIRFSKLESGDYKLVVRKINGFGLRNEMTRQINIIVTKEWYETMWFRVLFCIAIVFAIYFYIRLRTEYLKNKNTELESKIASRTYSLQQANLALTISEKELNRQMHIRTRLVASISHDVRSPLKFLISAADRIFDISASRENPEIPAIAKNISSSAARMSQLLENMVGYIKTQFQGEQIDVKRVSLKSIIDEKAALFASAIQSQDNRILNNVGSKVMVYADRQLLAIVIHNLIDNANKNTYEGSIEISTQIIDRKLHMIIADSGPGFPDHLLHWVNNTEQTDKISRPPHASDESHGLGLLMIKEIIALLEIKILVENRNGAKVHLIFNDQINLWLHRN
jgi:signal transduction histidine kinase